MHRHTACTLRSIPARPRPWQPVAAYALTLCAVLALTGPAHAVAAPAASVKHVFIVVLENE